LAAGEQMVKVAVQMVWPRSKSKPASGHGAWGREGYRRRSCGRPAA